MGGPLPGPEFTLRGTPLKYPPPPPSANRESQKVGRAVPIAPPEHRFGFPNEGGARVRARFLSSSFPLFVQGRRRRAPFGPFQSIPKLSLATTASNTVNKISFWPVQYVSSNHESSPWVALGNEEFSERQNWEDSA